MYNRTPFVVAGAMFCASAAVGGAAVIVNFDVYPGGTPVQSGDVFTDQYASVGVEFSDGAGGGPGPAGNPCSYSPPNHAAAGGLIIAYFVDPCTGVLSATDFAGTRQDWCWVPGEGIDMYAYDKDGVLLAHQFNSGGGNLVTFSFGQPVIARLEMFHIGQGIDDFVFNSPVPVLRGDLDCDGDVETADIGPFVLALLDPSAYDATFPSCDRRRADMNCDRQVDGLDVGPFVDALLNP